jgi:hypothetical protein
MHRETEARRTIHVDDDTDRLRYRCPNGHSNIEATNNHWWCQSCARQERQGEDVDPEFHELHDVKTDDRLTREEVRFVEDSPTSGVRGRV